MGTSRRVVPALFAVSLSATLACSFCGLTDLLGTWDVANQPADISAEDGGTVELADGEILTISPGALTEDTEVTLRPTGKREPMGDSEVVIPASMEYEVDLGDADQVGEITLGIMVPGEGAESPPAGRLIYVAWAQPKGGIPSLVGVRADEKYLTLPVVGAGLYQIFAIPDPHDYMAISDVSVPLVVPTYPQMTPAWCSPTALTDLAQFHQGAWPLGGFGAMWGESANWFLAGMAGEAFNHGFFFHWLLGAVGYNVPADVKTSFSNPDNEVFIWNWRSMVLTAGEVGISVDGLDPDDVVYVNYTFAEYLWEAYRAYVESYVWGAQGPRQPVAWGSSLAGHSRVITGSDGESFFFNNPSSGSLNESKTWEAYHQEVIDSLTAEKIEVIDTVVLHSPPRPERERRGVLWLLPWSENSNGSILMRSGTEESIVWIWDGSYTHDFGYYYQDNTGELPQDTKLGAVFIARTPDDMMEVNWTALNITDTAYEFGVDIYLYDMSGILVDHLFTTSLPLSAHQSYDLTPPLVYDFSGLMQGSYRLQFVLTQDGIHQDVKHVFFKVGESPLFLSPQGVLTERTRCRMGPGPTFDSYRYFQAGEAFDFLGVSPDQTWGLFVPRREGYGFECWFPMSAVDIFGNPEGPVIEPPPAPEAAEEDDQPPWLTVSHLPNAAGHPNEDDAVTFDVIATDNVGVAKIEIWVQAPSETQQLVKTCTATGACSFTGGPYDTGDLTYWAKAWDEAGNKSETIVNTVFIIPIPR